MTPLPYGIDFFERGWLSSNNVLIHDQEQAVLIDSGYYTHAHQTHALVSSVLDKPLTALINTHLHSDHCGGNAFLQSQYPNLNTYIPNGHAHFVDSWNPAALSYTLTGQHCPPFKKTGVLSDGDVFAISNKEWRCYSAPGHDPHSVIFFNGVDGILISADALWENGFGVVFPEIEGISAFDEIEATLDIIEQLKPRIVLPGHGSAFEDVQLALSRAKSRLAQFRNDPTVHASYAAKVLLKFKLLELQQLPYAEFLNWATNVPYLQTLASKYFGNMNFDSWVASLCTNLERNGACKVSDNLIYNIN